MTYLNGHPINDPDTNYSITTTNLAPALAEEVKRLTEENERLRAEVKRVDMAFIRERDNVDELKALLREARDAISYLNCKQRLSNHRGSHTEDCVRCGAIPRIDKVLGGEK